jgi:hypothetical protein
MKVLQNTLYVMTEGSYLNLDHETVVINAEDGSKKQHIPLHQEVLLNSIGTEISYIVSKVQYQGTCYCDAINIRQYKIQVKQLQ